MEANYPDECVLAFAIPLTRERFLSALAQPEDKDFVFQFRKGRGLERADPDFCWQVYETEEAALVSAVCEQIADHGVSIAYDVDLTQLTALLTEFPVVTLVAHSRFVEFEIADIATPAEILNLLREPPTDLHQQIRESMIDLDPDLLECGDGVESLQSRLCNVFRTIANQAEKLYADEDVQTTRNLELYPGTRLTRAEFERAFPSAIQKARVLEFSDGLHTIPELVQSIPSEFSGLLDLTVCNSVIPAAAIRDERRCLVAGNRKPAELRARMYLYGVEIASLATNPRPFIDVIRDVHSRPNPYDKRGGTLWKLSGWLCSIMQRRRR